MQQCKLDLSPIVYYTSGKEDSEWVLFLHAAFVDHNMFQPQIQYFENKYNILAVDIIGHGKSTDTKKGDCLEKMSAWIYDIMSAEKIKKYILSVFPWALFWHRILQIDILKRSIPLPALADMISIILIRKCRKKIASHRYE